MPIYEFECSACSHIFERFMKVTENYQDLACPECRTGHPKKLVGLCRFHSRERYEEHLANRMASRARADK